MKRYSPSDKLVVRDSIDLSDISEVEDDVFIRDGKTSKTYEDTGLKRPLMAPRRKHGKTAKIIPIMKKQRTKCYTCCEPFCYGLAAITILIALIFLAALILTMFPVPLQKIKIWFRKDLSFTSNYSSSYSFSNLFHYGSGSNSDLELVPCTQITVRQIWSKAIAKLSTETPIRKADLNGDGVDDIIIGYGIEEVAEGEELPKCTSSKTGIIDICTGGVLAMDGVTGVTLWQRWTAYTIFSVFCANDLNNDTQIDCVASGRGGLIVSLNGKDGSIIWESTDASDLQIITIAGSIDLYTINVIRDVNDDGVNDIVAAHVEDNGSTSGSHIKLISGATGKQIRIIPAPNREEIFVPIQVVTDMDGSEFFLVLTGGQNSPGGIYKIPLFSMSKPLTQVNFGTIFRNPDSGFMVPAVIVDINGDTIDDIIVSDFNSTVYAFDGKSYTTIWSYTFQASESVSSIVPGFYDHDNVTDFLVKYSSGPGFPIYYYSRTAIISGLNGSVLLDNMIVDSGGPNSLLAGLSISQKSGGDIFLHWQVTCRGIDSPTDQYQFIPESDLIQQSRADMCGLRYNTTTVLKLYALTRHVEPPGLLIFSSDDLTLVLNQTSTIPKSPSQLMPIKHPKMKLHKMQQAQLEKFKNLETKESEVNGNIPNLVPDQDKKRTNTDARKNTSVDGVNSSKNKDDDDDDNGQEPLKPKPKPHKNNFAIEMNEDGAYAPEPYQYLPTFDEKELAKEYNLKIPYPRLDDSTDYEYGLPEDGELPPIPKGARNRYGNRNRGIRSKNEKISIKDSSIVKKNLNDHINGNQQLPNGQQRPESLWDLELEKEEYEAYRFKRDTNYVNLDVLPAIASTGILLKPLNSTNSALDYVFALNVRESERYPPLLLKEDIDCVEEKMQGFRSYAATELRILERKYFKQCLSKRIPFLSPPYQRYETQMVVTRIRIECKCSESLDSSTEKCSELNPINRQVWPEYMGSNKNGAFSRQK